MPSEFLHLTAAQLEGCSRDHTLFIFPVGSLEDHGPHLPMGLDMIEAHAVSQELAQKIETDLPSWKTVLMPCAPFGVETHTLKTAFPIRAHVLRDWIVDACLGLSRRGFRYFVGVSGILGPKQLTTLEEISSILQRRVFLRTKSRKPIFISASSALVKNHNWLQSPFWPDPLEHGGVQDTSVGLALDPKKVDPLYKNLPAVSKEPSAWVRFWNRVTYKTAGYWGDPSQATAEKGRKQVSQTVDQIYSRLRPLLEGGKIRSEFRSWYSILPPNRSFFMAWLLALILVLLMFFYAYFSYKWMLGL